MSVHEIVTRLKSLSETNKNLTPRISSLAKLFSTDSQTQDNKAESQLRIDLSADIHQELKELEEELELIKQEAEDITSSGSWSSGARRANEERDRERVSVAGQVERLGEDLKLSRAQFRKAQLQAKRNAEIAQRKEREQLFAGAEEAGKSVNKRRGQEKLSEDDVLLNASTDVTAALRRTHQLMTSELQRSQFAHETLQRSTTALQSLNESYGNLDSLLSSSKSLVSTLVSSSKSDTWYLENAVRILVITLVWLVFRRVFYGPVRYLAYLPTKWMINIFLSFLQLFAGVFAASSNSDTGVVSSSLPSVAQPAEIPLGRREGRANPKLPRIHIPSGMGGQGAKTGHGQADEKLSEKIGRMTEERNEQSSGKDETLQDKAQGDPEAEVEADDHQWTAGDEDEEEEQEHQGQETVLREPREDEPPNPKKRMWEEPLDDDDDGHDEL